ncbi:MAG: very short patch repair endonuclease [Burkholderiales bacterium]|nr:very short patch repair endonuclease [Burkholderiales bacterium]
MPRAPEVTRRIMSSIKSKNTKPEMALRRALWRHGLRYRVNVNALSGKPDIVFTKAKIAVFCDGDFWHGHNWVVRGIESLDAELERYSSYWKNKILNNIRRDTENTILLESLGWIVIRVWESEIKSDVSKCVNLIVEKYTQRTQS